MLKIGADPEVFIRNNETNEIVSVEGMIENENGEGSKILPLVVDDEVSLQEDNVLAEYNIAPCETEDQWVGRHKHALNIINLILPDECSYEIRPSAELDWLHLQTDQALLSGCASERDAWVNKDIRGVDLSLMNLRCAGGHIHLGYDFKSKEELRNLIKVMDYYLGIPSLILDEDKERRKLYGAAGAFRYKSYGVEYRTLSNFWLKSEELMRWAFSQTQLAFENKDMKVPDIIRKIINTQDVEAASKICKQNKILV